MTITTVVIVDSLEPDAHRVTPLLDGRAAHREHSVCDLDAMLDAVRGCDAVCHQAAKVGLGVDFSDVVAYVHHNDLGTATLLRAMHDQGFRGRYVSRAAWSSTARVRTPANDTARYARDRGDPESLAAGQFEPPCPACGRALSSLAIPETAALSPRNVYAATKLHQEHLAHAFELEHPGVVATALRYHNVYGPRMPRDTPYAGVASIFRSALASGKSPRVFEDGGQRRDFVHVEDVARANVLALTGPERVRGRSTLRAAHPTRSSRWPRRSLTPPARMHPALRWSEGGAPAMCVTSPLHPFERARSSASARRSTSPPGYASSQAPNSARESLPNCVHVLLLVNSTD